MISLQGLIVTQHKKKGFNGRYKKGSYGRYILRSLTNNKEAGRQEGRLAVRPNGSTRSPHPTRSRLLNALARVLSSPITLVAAAKICLGLLCRPPPNRGTLYFEHTSASYIHTYIHTCTPAVKLGEIPPLPGGQHPVAATSFPVPRGATVVAAVLVGVIPVHRLSALGAAPPARRGG